MEDFAPTYRVTFACGCQETIVTNPKANIEKIRAEIAQMQCPDHAPQDFEYLTDPKEYLTGLR